MDGLIGRLTTAVKAWISQLLGAAEDPAVTLDYSYERQRELLQNVKRGVADVVTAKKRIQLQSDKLEQTVVKLESQARQALASGREDLARTALERKDPMRSSNFRVSTRRRPASSSNSRSWSRASSASR